MIGIPQYKVFYQAPCQLEIVMYTLSISLAGAAALLLGLRGFFLAVVKRQYAWLPVGIGAMVLATWLLHSA